MKEYLDIYSLQGEFVKLIEKSEAHKKMRDEFMKKGKVTVKHKHVRLMLMTSNGRLLLQRRSKWKGDNPGKWDKSVGGHVSSGDSFDLAMLKECAEELGIPATVVNENEFEQTVSGTDTSILAVLKKICYLDSYQSNRISKDGKWTEPSMTNFYFGYYDGPIKFVDNESSGIQVFSLEELKEEIIENKEMFTDDVLYIIKKFSEQIKPAPKKMIMEKND